MQTQKPEVREAILREAKKLFITTGYERAGMRELAANIGMTVGNAYRYFKGKEAIFNEIVKGVKLTREYAESHPVEFTLLLERKLSKKFQLIKKLSKLDPDILMSMV